MEVDYAPSAFLASVLKAVRESCLQKTEFQNRVFVTGFLCIDVDGNHQNHYVINEEVVRETGRVEEESSSSFCLKRIDMEKATPQCSQQKNKTPSYTFTSTRKPSISPKRNLTRRNGTWSKSSSSTGGQKLPIEQKQIVVGTKPIMLAKSRQLKINRTFTIEDDDQEPRQRSFTQMRQGCSSYNTSPRRTWLNQRAGDRGVRGSSSQGTYSCSSSFSNVTPKSRTTIQSAHKHMFVDDKNRSLMKRTKSYHNSHIHSKQQHQNITKHYGSTSNDADFPHEVELNHFEERLNFVDTQEYFDSEIAISSTKPPEGFVQRNLEPFQQHPDKHTPETGTPVKNMLETFVPPNGLEDDNKHVASPEEISALLNNVIEVLSQSKQSHFSVEKPPLDPQQLSPISFTDYPQSSPRAIDSVQDAIVGLRYNTNVKSRETNSLSLADMEQRFKDRREFEFMNSSMNRSPEGVIGGGAEVMESPSVIKKKAKLFKWMKIFNKKDSGPYRLRDEQPSGIPITESHTSVNSIWSIKSKTSRSPAFKKRRLGQTR